VRGENAGFNGLASSGLIFRNNRLLYCNESFVVFSAVKSRTATYDLGVFVLADNLSRATSKSEVQSWHPENRVSVHGKVI
jgi:hypothetical protein